MPTSPLEALAEVRCPVSVLVADAPTADDEDQRERLLALEDVQRRRGPPRAWPNTRVRRFAGAGHDLMRHRPDEVARASWPTAGRPLRR